MITEADLKPGVKFRWKKEFDVFNHFNLMMVVKHIEPNLPALPIRYVYIECEPDLILLGRVFELKPYRYNELVLER